MRKYWKYLRFIVIPTAILLVCWGLYFIVDQFSDGVLADWLSRRFSYETSEQEGDVLRIVQWISWDSVKEYIFNVILLLALVGSWIGIVISDVVRQRVRRKHAREVAAYLRRYLLTDEPLPARLPPDDAEVFSKISEARRKMDRETALLREESQRKNDLVTYLAHDLKTPLTSVIGYLTLLRDVPDMPTAQRAKYTGVALKKAQRLEELTAEMFEITRFNLSGIELSPEDVNLSRMLEQMASEFAPLLTEKDLRIETDLAPDVHCVCDVEKTERVFDNLLRNAVNYSSPDSAITLVLTEEGETVKIVTENRCRTIPSEKLERIFEPFYRLDAARSSATGGTGLGLAIARQLTEAQGGTIAAESENGTARFTVTLPVRKS
ncbi:MAG: HAMP domain-containing histidine kinase [Clostridia bacterium]|nr:HAMP domain-containing histidine kinase [Clostridia bacterium]